MSTLFISHSSVDAAMAEELAHLLLTRGYASIFLDSSESYGIVGGDNWERQLYIQLQTCSAVLVLCSEDWLASKWCFAELVAARLLGKPIIPLHVGSCPITPSIAELQVIDWLQDARQEHVRLWRSLEQIGLHAAHAFTLPLGRPAYPGLMSFEEADAAVYFGREQEVRDVIRQLTVIRQFHETGLMLIVGASGAGKSSLVRAGILPRLKKDPANWLIIPPLRLRGSPGQELARVLGLTHPIRTADEVCNALRTRASEAGYPSATALLVLDQFEELLVADRNGESSRFLDIIATVVGTKSSIIVIATLRSDSLMAFQNHAILRDVPLDFFVLGHMPRTRFAEVIEGPARAAAATFDAGLVQRMMLDVETPEALPLLAFTLRELWDRASSDRRLQIATYADVLGGIQGAVATVAKTIMGNRQHSDEQKTALMNAFLQLVQLNEANQCVRRSEEWRTLPLGAQALLQCFVDARLLVSNGEGQNRTLEVAHESLFRVWSELVDWIHDNRTFLEWRQGMAWARAEWERSGCDREMLLHGRRLRLALQQTKVRANAISPDDAKFIALSAARARTRSSRVAATVLSGAVLLGLLFVAVFLSSKPRLSKGVGLARFLDVSLAARKIPSDASLAEFLRITKRDITFIAYDDTYGDVLALNARTAPDLPVSWAVRMAAATPQLFEPVNWKPEWGEYQKHNVTGHVIADSVGRSLLPIQLFEGDYPELTGRLDYSHLTLAVIADAALQCPNAPKAQVEEKLEVRRLSEMTDQSDNDVMRQYAEKICRVPVKGYGIGGLDLTPARFVALSAAAHEAMSRHLNLQIIAPGGVSNAKSKPVDLALAGTGARALAIATSLVVLDERGISIGKIMAISTASIPALLLSAGYRASEVVGRLSERSASGETVITGFLSR